MDVQSAIAAYIRKQGRLKSCIAEKAGIRQSRLSQIIHNHVKMKFCEFVLLAKAFDLTPSEFLEELRKIQNETE